MSLMHLLLARHSAYTNKKKTNVFLQKPAFHLIRLTYKLGCSYPLSLNTTHYKAFWMLGSMFMGVRPNPLPSTPQFQFT